MRKAAAAKAKARRLNGGRDPHDPLAPHTPRSRAKAEQDREAMQERWHNQTQDGPPKKGQPTLAAAGGGGKGPTSLALGKPGPMKMAAQGLGHTPVPAGRVAAPGGRVVDYLIYDDDAKVPAHYRTDPRFRSLATDPAHVGITDAKMRQEAMAGLEAEHQGLVPGPITRGPKEIEFYDGNGSPWDVKTPPSPKPGETWPFKPKKIVEGIQKELVGKGTPPGTYPNANTGIPEPRQIILDSSYMNPADHAALWKDLNSTLTPSELNRIVEVNTRT